MKRALLVLLSVLAVGCVSLNVQRLDEVARPAHPPESVAVLLEEPDQPYTVIAVLESSVDGALKGFDDLRRKMIDEAAQLGGGCPDPGTRIQEEQGHLRPDAHLLR